jgi:penicillin-binding protein 1A
VNAASKFYFGHPATEITPAEAAIMVIQCRTPRTTILRAPNRAMDRQQEVLRQMVALGYLEKQAADESFNEYWAAFDYTRTASSAYLTRNDKARWFSEYVRRQLEGMIYGTMDIYSGGYTVHTTVDLQKQAVADEVMQSYIELANKRFRASSSSRFAKADTYGRLTELLALGFNIPSLAVSSERQHAKAMGNYQKRINRSST